MEALILIGLISGIVTALSPCVLPVLPVVLVAATNPADEGAANTAAARRRPFIVIAGLLTSFTVFTLLGGAALTLLGLPQDFLRWAGIIVLAVAGLGLLIPQFGELIERPFARVPMRHLNRNGGGFTLGLGLGLVFVPCAGPVLAAITVLSATGSIDLRLVALTVSFAAGVSIPLLAFALAGQRIGERIKAFRTHAPAVRRASGAILLVMAFAISFNVTETLQRFVPGYVAAVQERVEDSDAARDALGSLTGATSVASFDECSKEAGTLRECGTAPEFAGIQQWFNTPGDKPLSLAGLKGKVTLVDFWTYSCINCQRTVPKIAGWQSAYANSGLQVVGVHTPEFPFEREVANVKRGAADLGVNYPVAIDNGYETWTAYGNRYWPAHYLIDATGQVRQVHYGEGKYAETEQLIRELLIQANPGVELPPQTGAADSDLTKDRTPETYLGANRMEGIANGPVAEGEAKVYVAVESLPRDQFALSGQWTVEPQFSLAGADATLKARTYAAKSYAVLAGTGVVEVLVDGQPTREFTVSGTPRLYPLVDGEAREADVELRFTSGLQIYALTFG